MTASAPFFALARDPRLSPYATSAVAAWLWKTDGSGVLWANASAAALFGAADPLALTEKSFVGHDLAAQIARIGAELPAAGAAQPERLTGANGADALACLCSRITLGADAAILIVAAQPVAPVLPLAQRAERLFAASPTPLAVFSGMGALLYASAAIADRVSATTLAALGAGALMAEAIASGHARGDSALGPLTLERMGSGGATVLVATLNDEISPELAPDIPEIVTETAEHEPEPEDIREPAQTLAAEPIPPPAESAEAVTAAEVERDLETIAAADAAPDMPAPTQPVPPQETAPPVTEAAFADDDLLDFAPPVSPAVATTPTTDDAPAAEEPTVAAEPPLATEPASNGKRYPLRFVWTMDAALHFTLASSDFADAVGPRTAALLGRPWDEIAASLALDPEGRVARAVASHDTWSGITIDWPVDGIAERVGVELSGLPIFDRDRSFLGYRGFGVCRDTARLAAATAARGTEVAATPQATPAGADVRPLLTVVPAAKNVVPFRAAAPATDKRPSLTPVERTAFSEIAAALGGTTPAPAAVPASSAAPAAQAAPPATLPSAFAVGADADIGPEATETEALALLERLPVGILIHHGEALIYANRALLEWTGYGDLTALAEAGGLECLMVEPGEPLDRHNGTGKTFTIATRSGENLTCEGRLYTVPWNGETTLMLVLTRTTADERLKAAELALRVAETETRELRSILDTATDGVVIVDREGRILALNRAAQALFGYDHHEMARRPFTELFAPESEHAARDSLEGLTRGGVASALDDGRQTGREVIGRARTGAPIPLFMTMGRIGEGSDKLCAVLRDITPWKRSEEDLTNAKRSAERASSAKSDFLAKISHEIRTPLNAIIGFSEVMMEERFGPIGNDRYRDYLKDIHASGGHLVSLINDLLDLSKIEAGKLDLVLASVDLNSLVQQCVALMQPQANQQRIIIRSSLSANLPPLVADARSVRQIVLNLLSNSIKFTGAGGQVIVSTAATERGEIALRVRDTGVGMTEKEIETAMEPFRQLATSTRYGSGGTGLGLPLTKALAEANHARFAIKSQKDAGTLVEIAFPGARAAAE